MKYLLIIFVFCTIPVFGQVGMWPEGADENYEPKTTLDVKAETHNGAFKSGDGVTVPRVNSIGVDGIVDGQLIYLTANDTVNGLDKGFYFWNNTAWKQLGIPNLTSTGGEQVFIGGWYMGDIHSGNNLVSEVKGSIQSVSFESALSANQGATYTVVMDQNYLSGTLGEDFQIISSMISQNPGSTAYLDGRTHRAVKKISDNSFQITFWNFEKSSLREQATSIAIIRNTDLASFEAIGSNLGEFQTYTGLTSTHPSPYKNDVATIYSYDASISHINGTAVPTSGQENYSIYYDGSDWVYTGWREMNFESTSWILDPNGLKVRSVSAPLVKATTAEFDIVRYRELGNNWVEVEMKYAAESGAGASSGSGDYLFKLPNNFKFDLTEHPTYTGQDVISNSTITRTSLPVDQSVISQNNQSGSEAMLIPYSENQFRALCYSGSTDNEYVRSGTYSLDVSDSVYYFRFRFKRS